MTKATNGDLPETSLSQQPSKRQRGRPKGRPGPDDETVGPEALIALTCRLLDDVPPGDISRATIARAANVDPGLIRYYFRNRDTLLRAAAMELTSRLKAQNSTTTIAENQGFLGKIASRIANLFKFKIRHPYYHRLMLEEVARSEDNDSRTFFATQNQKVVELYESMISAGVEQEGLSPLDARFLYIAVIGMCESFVTGELLLKSMGLDRFDQNTIQNYEDFIVRIVAKALSGDPLNGTAS